MAWLAIGKEGEELVFEIKPNRWLGYWTQYNSHNYVELPTGSIEKLIGRKLTWDDEPVEIK